MCGIVGAFVFDSSGFKVTEPYLTRMRDVMEHRGPDGGGLWISDDRRIGLGHRRLSIIDLSNSANQPMASVDGSLQVVFNGEIYNHAEIRAELNQIRPRRWQTDHSDTEVILHAYDEWGIDGIVRGRPSTPVTAFCSLAGSTGSESTCTLGSSPLAATDGSAASASKLA